MRISSMYAKLRRENKIHVHGSGSGTDSDSEEGHSVVSDRQEGLNELERRLRKDDGEPNFSDDSDDYGSSDDSDDDGDGNSKRGKGRGKNGRFTLHANGRKIKALNMKVKRTAAEQAKQRSKYINPESLFDMKNSSRMNRANARIKNYNLIDPIQNKSVNFLSRDMKPSKEKTREMWMLQVEKDSIQSPTVMGFKHKNQPVMHWAYASGTLPDETVVQKYNRELKKGWGNQDEAMMAQKKFLKAFETQNEDSQNISEEDFGQAFVKFKKRQQIARLKQSKFTRSANTETNTESNTNTVDVDLDVDVNGIDYGEDFDARNLAQRRLMADALGVVEYAQGNVQVRIFI